MSHSTVITNLDALLTPPEGQISILRGRVTLRNRDIVRLEGDRNYTRFVLHDGTKILTSKSLSFYEPLLPDFVRVHKQSLLNRCYITDFGALQVRMNDGFVAKVARRKRKEVSQIKKIQAPKKTKIAWFP